MAKLGFKRALLKASGSEKFYTLALNMPADDGWTAQQVAFSSKYFYANARFVKEGEAPRLSGIDLNDNRFNRGDDPPVKHADRAAFADKIREVVDGFRQGKDAEALARKIIRGLSNGFNASSGPDSFAMRIPLDDGWRISGAQSSADSTFILTEFRKRGEAPVKARLDIGKRVFIDATPLKDAPVEEVQAVADRVVESLQAKQAHKAAAKTKQQITNAILRHYEAKGNSL